MNPNNEPKIEKVSRIDAFIHRNWRLLYIMVAISIDAFAIGASGLVALFVRENFFRLHPIPAFQLFDQVVYSVAITITFALVLGLYRASYRTEVVHQYQIAARAYLFATLFVLASAYLLRWSQLPRVFTSLFLAIVPVVYIAGRLVLRWLSRLMQRLGFGLYRTLLIDDGTGGPHLFRRFDLLPELGYNVVSLAAWRGSPSSVREYGSVQLDPCENAEELLQIIQKRSIEQVMVPTVESRTATIADILVACKKAGVNLKLLSHESEEALRFSYVHDIAGVTLYSPPRRKIELAKRIVKRAFDIVASGLAILLFSPLMILSCAAILLDDGWPIFYGQKRALAKGKKEFDMLKFRTMVKDAESQQAHLYRVNQTSGGLFLLKDDPRLLKVGRILRKYSLDELPQFLNVFLGDMSLVGPRPLSLADLHNVTPENSLSGYSELRAGAKPGITGLWQISGRREVSFKEMVLLDLYYIDNQSVVFDIEILLNTIPVVLFGRGGY